MKCLESKASKSTSNLLATMKRLESKDDKAAWRALKLC